jgi:hypothetical protein
LKKKHRLRVFDNRVLRKIFGPGFDGATNRNEYQEYSLGVKAAGA